MSNGDKQVTDQNDAPKDDRFKNERFKTEYKKHDDDVRHYSTTRSALTSFLITVSLTLLASSFSKDHASHPGFLQVIGFAVLVAAIVTCLVFSWRTQRSDRHLRDLWEWATTSKNKYPEWSDKRLEKNERKERKSKIWKEVRWDPMNWALAFLVGVIILVFGITQSRQCDTALGCSAKCNKESCECEKGQMEISSGSSQSNSTAAAQAYALAVSSSAAAATAYAEAAAIARDAAKTYAECLKTRAITCGCETSVHCEPACPKRRAREH